MAEDEPPSNGDAQPQATDKEHQCDDQEVEALEKELDDLEADIQALIDATSENPTDENIQSLLEVVLALDETSDLLDTSALESRLDTLSQPVTFTQVESDVYKVDESLALLGEVHEDEIPSGGTAAAAKEEPKETKEDQSPAADTSVSLEEEKIEPVGDSQPPPSQDDSSDSRPLAPQPEFSYQTPSHPVELKNVLEMTPVKPEGENKSPAPTFKSILVPVIADLNKLHPTNYRVPITVGTKHFLPILDTGSSLLWVPAKMTFADEFPPHVPVYEAEKLKRRLDSSPIHYGADTVDYRAVIDTCYLGDVGVEKFRFGGAFGEIFAKPDKKHLSQGILGISPSPPAVVKDGTIVSDRANMIQCLEGKIFRTVCTLIGPKFNPKLADQVEQRDDNIGRGFLAVGELSRDFFSGEMAWCPNLVRDKWVVELDKIIINGKEMSPRRRTALIDTGTSYVCAPERDFDELSQMLAGNPLAEASPFFSVPKEKLTEVAFVLGGRKLPLRDEDMFLGKAGELTKHAPNPEEYVSSIVRKPGVSKGDDFMDYWVLGGIFLDNGVTSFAYSPFGAISSVGFADIPETDLENWEGKPPDPWDTSYSGGYFKRS